MSKIFLDANIVLDLIDEDRGSVAQTKSEIAKYIKNTVCMRLATRV